MVTELAVLPGARQQPLAGTELRCAHTEDGQQHGARGDGDEVPMNWQTVAGVSVSLQKVTPQTLQKRLKLAMARVVRYHPGSKRGIKWRKRVGDILDEMYARAQMASGQKGGKSRSDKKVAAARLNAAKARAARKAVFPKCPGYKNGSHRWDADGRCYSPICRQVNPELWRDRIIKPWRNKVPWLTV